ncbi:MAG: hypothetical protein CMF60_05795 [Magnetococcales bacterium]|nr:hypothetical protein [Magnetococcales bacterium]|tara:strand:- start:7511 stop:8626 length:1116 start_codon:yes stop_codon:yes gene_type:complete
MQSIFILALFGILYSTVAVITTMLSTSAMQKKLERIEYVEQFFEDIEIGITKGYLGEFSDFASAGLTISVSDYRVDSSQVDPVKRLSHPDFLPKYISYSPDAFEKDPWGTNYYMAAFVTDVMVYADNASDVAIIAPAPGNNEAKAPVAVFLLYSAGPDKQFGDATPPGTYNTMRRFSKPTNTAGEDDIIRVFTTLGTMQEMWNHTQDVFDKMVSAVADNFKQQYDLFTPTIQTEYYDKVDFYDSSFNWVGDNNAPGCGTPLIHAWKDDQCDVDNVTDFDSDGKKNLVGAAGFPVMYGNTTTTDSVMMQNLGIDAEYARMIPNLLNNLDLRVGSTTTGYLDVMEFVIEDSGSTEWEITYSKRLEGGDIISGL